MADPKTTHVTREMVRHARGKDDERDGEIARLRAALEWYRDRTAECRLIHSGGDAGRAALSADGGKRAREALSYVG